MESQLALDALARAALASVAAEIAILWTLDDDGVAPRAAAGISLAAASTLLANGFSDFGVLEISLPPESGFSGALCILDRRRGRLYDSQEVRALERVARAAAALLGDETLQSSRYDVLREAAAFGGIGVSVFSIGTGEAWPTCEFISEGSRARMGFSNAELTRDTAAYYRLGENARALEHIVARARSGDETPFEIELTARSGERYWTEVIVRALQSNGRERLRYVTIARPITERKRAERDRDRLAAAIEATPSGVLVVELQPEHILRPAIAYSNDGFGALTGYGKAEIARGIYPVILGERSERGIVRDATERVLRGEHVHVEVELYRRDGTPFWAEVRAHALGSPPEYAVLLINDISERRANDDWMRLLSESVEQANDFVLLFDDTPPDAGGPLLLYANRAFYEATCYEPEDLLGRTYTAFYSERNDAVLMRSIRETLRAGDVNYREILVRRKDGSEFWIEFVGKPFVMADGRVQRMSIGRDISLRRRSTNQLALLFAALDQAPSPVVLYEAGISDDLEAAYENGASVARDRYRLLELWGGASSSSGDVRARILAGERVHLVFAEHDARGVPTVVDFTAIPVRNGARLEAVLTVERMLGIGASEASDRSRLLSLSTLLSAFREVRTSDEHIQVLRALLLDTFEAELAEEPSLRHADSVQINASARQATFRLSGRSYRIQWTQPLEGRDLTALRFCVEACIEHVQAVAEGTFPS